MNIYRQLRYCLLESTIYVLLIKSIYATSKNINREALFSLQEEVPIANNNYPGTSSKKNKSNVLDETKEILIKSFGLRRNMIDLGNNITKREPHKYILYMSQEFERKYRNGIANVANTIRGITDIGRGKKLTLSPSLSYKFDVSEIPPSETLVLSEVKILLKAPNKNIRDTNSGNLYKVTLYVVIKRHSSSSFPLLLEVNSKTMTVTKAQDPRWITFDISSILPGIGNINKKIIKFVLRVIPINGGTPIDPSMVGFQGSQARGTEKALLVLFTDDINDEIKTTTRKKRNLPAYPEFDDSELDKRKYNTDRSTRKKDKKKKRKKRKYRSRRKGCRKKDMTVDFEQLGWGNWLLSPPRYNAFYCHGHCKTPLDKYTRPTNHAIIQSMVHSMDSNFVPPACCVPTEFDVLPVLSLDGNDRVVYKLKKGLIAIHCGCR